MTARISRRSLTFGLGASLLAAPFVNLLTPRRARAATTGARAKRLVLFFSPNGTIPRLWRPSGDVNQFLFPAGSVLEPLAKQQSDLVVLDEMNFYMADNHAGGMHAMLTANGDTGSESQGMSFDQYVAQAIGQKTRFPSLELGVQTSDWGGNIQTRMSYSAPGVFVTPDDDPENVFKRLFGDAVGGAAALDKLKARRKSILDGVTSELTALHGRLGAEERIKLEAHLASIRSVETSLDAESAGTGTCSAPRDPGAMAVYDNDTFPKLTKAQLDIGVQALACGLTNVVSIQLSHTVGDRVFSWIGLTDGHHTLSHSDDTNTAKVNDFIAAERWCAGQFGYLVDQLKNTPDPEDAGSTLFDTSVILWVKELGDSRLHTCVSVPWVVAGKGGGTITPGRYLQLGGANHARVLTQLCHAFGMQNETFGDPASGTGGLGVLA